MRVIAGKNRGLKLQAPRGLETRPTSDRLRGAVYSALGDRVEGARVWDVCAGTGAVGIEALSRGASRALFCETAAPALAALRANLLRARLEEQARVLELTWERVLERLVGDRESFDLVYFDPPFSSGSSGRFLSAVERLVAPRGTVVVEHPSRDIPPAGQELMPARTLRAGGASATLYRRAPPRDEEGLADG